MSIIKIWVGNLGKYNEGELVGEWFDLPIDFSVIKQAIGLNSQYEELYIGDYEAPFNISEYASIDKLNKLAEQLSNYDKDTLEVIIELMEEGIIDNLDDIEKVLEDTNIYYGCPTEKDVAIDYIREIGFIADHMLDVDYYLQDLETDNYFVDEDGEDLNLLEEEKYEMAKDMLVEADIETKIPYVDYDYYVEDMEQHFTFLKLSNDRYAIVGA